MPLINFAPTGLLEQEVVQAGSMELWTRSCAHGAASDIYPLFPRVSHPVEAAWPAWARGVASKRLVSSGLNTSRRLFHESADSRAIGLYMFGCLVVVERKI